MDLSQPLLAANHVIMMALSSDAFVIEPSEADRPDYKREPRGCVQPQALPDPSSQLGIDARSIRMIRSRNGREMYVFVLWNILAKQQRKEALELGVGAACRC